MRKAISRIRVVIVSREYVVVSKMSSRGPEGDRGAGALAGLHRADLLESAVGHAEREGLAPQVAAVLHLDDRAGCDSALTTETPTPCRPPETL